MKYFLDTEFDESGPNRPITLISLGIVAEDGREYYAVTPDWTRANANQWVKDNVLPHLGTGPRKGLMVIAAELRNFIADKPEFWGYYADYDWVVFCQIFGAMVDLPKGWPMYCRDLKQLCDSLGNPKLPEQQSNEHNALNDARWNKQAHEFLETLASLPVGESTPLGRQKFAVVRYTNYKGQTANRKIVPVRIYFGSTEQHPEEQWLLEAFDLGRNAARTFAMKDMQWNPELPVGRQPYKLIQLCELHHLGQLDCPNCTFIEPEPVAKRKNSQTSDWGFSGHIAVLPKEDAACPMCAKPIFTEVSEPVAYRVKDFGDGWILHHTLEAARDEADGVGNLIQPLYAHPLPVGESRWISVEEKLPEDDATVLAAIPSYDNDRKLTEVEVLHCTYWIVGGQKIFTTCEGEEYLAGDVTHWMPWPKPPKLGIP